MILIVWLYEAFPVDKHRFRVSYWALDTLSRESAFYCSADFIYFSGVTLLMFDFHTVCSTCVSVCVCVCVDQISHFMNLKFDAKHLTESATTFVNVVF
jgi:hypothetical protein